MDRKAQSTLEYFLFFSIIIASLFSMQVYLKRGMQDRLKATTEQLNDGLAAYSPKATEAISSNTRNIEESASSFTICRDENGNAVDCFSLPEKERKRIRIFDSKVNIEQTTDRLETTLSFIDVP